MGVGPVSKMFNQKSWDDSWEIVFQNQEWGKYPPEELVRFIARNYYKVSDRKKVQFLDLGCGTGAATWYLAREGFSTFGIDGSETAIKKAKQRFLDENLAGNFKVGDFIQLDYPNAFFDCVTDIAALQHNSVENLRKILIEVLRILKSNGKIFSMVLSENCRFSNKKLFLEKKGYTHFFSKEEVLDLFSSFSNLKIDTTERTDQDNFLSYYLISGEKKETISGSEFSSPSLLTNLKIGLKLVGEKQPCFVIAEAGVNHNGNIEIAKQLIDKAKEIGVDAVKFQTWITEEIVTKEAIKAEYQKENWGSNSFYDEIKKLELSHQQYKELFDYAEKAGILCLSTPDDIKSLNYLVDQCEMKAIKVGSGTITDFRLLTEISKKAREKKIPILLSTGMSTLEEVEEAYQILSGGENQVALFHCTSNYPAKLENVNLLAMQTLKSKFNTVVGYSDHTLDRVTPIAAIALGAKIYEKHFTLDKKMPGPDHQASFNPQEFSQLLEDIRMTEKSLGHPDKKPVKDEEEIINVIRRSIVVDRPVKKGEIIKAEDLTFKIPGSGLSPKEIGSILGKTVKHDLAQDQQIKIEDLE